MSPPGPEFHRPVTLAAVPRAGSSHRLEASAAECAGLAARFGLPALHALSAELRLAPLSDGRVRATGRLEARLTQICVVSLEPFVQTLEAPFAVTYVPAHLAAAEAGEETEGAFDPEAADEEIAPGGVADLGESVAQLFALAIDPWPRHPDAVLPGEVAEGADAPAGTEAEGALPKSPFAVLARRRR